MRFFAGTIACGGGVYRNMRGEKKNAENCDCVGRGFCFLFFVMYCACCVVPEGKKVEKREKVERVRSQEMNDERNDSRDESAAASQPLTVPL